MSGTLSTDASAPIPVTECDVIVIGGGPAGSTTALVLARRGVRVIVLEKARHPRFHIGESFLPYGFHIIQELGLEPALRRLPHVPKYGAELAMGDASYSILFDFDNRFSPVTQTFNIARADFDAMLLQAARAAGADVRENVAVKQIGKLTDGDVSVTTDAGAFHAKWLVDASGQGTVVGRHLGTRKMAEEPHLRKTAYFGHFFDVWRPPGREAGHPLIAMHEEGWFWMIPLDERRTSIGMVIDPDIARNVQREQGIPAERMLAWGIARCPAVRNRMKNAIGPETNQILADFSYRCRPYAGPGYFLVGDAAAFMDPIFSTGVCVAMTGAVSVAGLVADLLAGKIDPDTARRRHIALIEDGTRTLFKIIRQYYHHSFRELFLNGTGPVGIHHAVIGVLAGNVFPRITWSVRWRLKVFEICLWLNQYVPMVPRRTRFSLLTTAPAPAAEAMQPAAR